MPAKLRVGLNGAGRIGRTLLRFALDETAFEIVHVNDLAGAPTIAHLLRHDSLFGAFPAPVAADGDDVLQVGGRPIAFTREPEPARIDWERQGVDVVVEATGRFTRGETARPHLRGPVQRVLVTAVADGADALVVLGPHDGRLGDAERVLSTGSCTTHAAALPLWLLNQWYGVAAAEMTTVHCTTGSQMTIDGPHSDPRRARSALLSMIPTTTSATRGLTGALPFLAGRLTCLAIRVPTASVSLVEIVAQTERPVDAPAQLAERFRRAAAEAPCAGRLGVTDEPLVSVDFKGDRHSSVVDLPLLACPGERLVRLVAWYDNEHGYTARVAELLRLIAARRG